MGFDKDKARAELNIRGMYASERLLDALAECVIEDAVPTPPQAPDRDERDIYVSEQGWEAFNDAIEQPPRNVEGFARLMSARGLEEDR